MSQACDANAEGALCIPFSRLAEWVSARVPDAVFVTISGAHLYGFPSVDSDFDLRGTHLAPIQEVLSLRGPRETITCSDTMDGLEMDVVSHELGKWLRLGAKPTGYMLEQLYSPLIVSTSEAHEDLRVACRGFICRRLYRHYRGFAYSQRRELAHTRKRVKVLLYNYRVLLTGIHVLRTGELEANLVRLNEHFHLGAVSDLLALKVREASDVADIEPHLREIEALHAQLEVAWSESPLPDDPDTEAVDRLFIRLRKQQLTRADIP